MKNEMVMFDFGYGNGLVAARRWINAGGHEGGIVAEGATVAEGAYIGYGATVGDRASLDDGAIIHAGDRRD